MATNDIIRSWIPYEDLVGAVKHVSELHPRENGETVTFLPGADGVIIQVSKHGVVLYNEHYPPLPNPNP